MKIQYYRKFGYATEIMGASFRNTGEILELAGCDLLTISPNLLDELRHRADTIEAKLTPQKAEAADLERVSFSEKSFRFEMNEDPMATEKNGGSHLQIHREQEKTPGDCRIQVLAQSRLINV